MERARYKHTASTQQLKQRNKIYSVEDGLKSEASRVPYRWHWNNFLKKTGLTQEKILSLGQDPKDPTHSQLHDTIIEYLTSMVKANKKHATINIALASIVHFCVMNDIVLNRTKIGKFIPSDENHHTDDSYTHKEIEVLLSRSDLRFKAVILLMANGLREGAIPHLEIGHLTDLYIGDERVRQKIYKISVYHRSKNSQYYTFVTPECTKTIDEYLEFRRKCGEKQLKKTSPLIRDQFNSRDPFEADHKHPKGITLTSLNKKLERLISAVPGLNLQGRVMRSHGFRKFAITMMKKAGVDFSDREYLVGHRFSRGLDINYDRTTEEERLNQWQKAVPLLTIDPTLRLKKKVKQIEGEQARTITDMSFEINRLKSELATKDKRAEEKFRELAKLKDDMYQVVGLLSTVGDGETPSRKKELQQKVIDKLHQEVGNELQDEWYEYEQSQQKAPTESRTKKAV